MRTVYFFAALNLAAAYPNAYNSIQVRDLDPPAQALHRRGEKKPLSDFKFSFDRKAANKAASKQSPDAKAKSGASSSSTGLQDTSRSPSSAESSKGESSTRLEMKSEPDSASTASGRYRGSRTATDTQSTQLRRGAGSQSLGRSQSPGTSQDARRAQIAAALQYTAGLPLAAELQSATNRAQSSRGNSRTVSSSDYIAERKKQIDNMEMLSRTQTFSTSSLPTTEQQAAAKRIARAADAERTRARALRHTSNQFTTDLNRHIRAAKHGRIPWSEEIPSKAIDASQDAVKAGEQYTALSAQAGKEAYLAGLYSEAARQYRNNARADFRHIIPGTRSNVAIERYSNEGAKFKARHGLSFSPGHSVQKSKEDYDRSVAVHTKAKQQYEAAVDAFSGSSSSESDGSFYDN